MSEYTLHFFDGIDTNELEEFMQVVDSAQAGDVVTIDLCNGGGSVFHGIGICDRMALAQTNGVKFISNVWGFAASAACLVALSCDEIRMSPNSALMYHSAWSETGDVDNGIAIANQAQQSLLSTRISKISAKDFEGEDHWITASVAQELNIIDSIIGNSTSDDDSEDIRVAAKFIYGGRKMARILKAENHEEEIKNEEVLEEEKVEEQASDENPEEPKAEDLDILEVIVQRLEGIERRLGVLESEGKTQEDLDHKEEGVSARRKALMAKLSAVCAPVQSVSAPKAAVIETPEQEHARFKAMYKNFDDMVSSYLKRK